MITITVLAHEHELVTTGCEVIQCQPSAAHRYEKLWSEITNARSSLFIAHVASDLSLILLDPHLITCLACNASFGFNHGHSEATIELESYSRSPCFCQIIGLSACGGKLQTLCSGVSEKSCLKERTSRY